MSQSVHVEDLAQTTHTPTGDESSTPSFDSGGQSPAEPKSGGPSMAELKAEATELMEAKLALTKEIAKLQADLNVATDRNDKKRLTVGIRYRMKKVRGLTDDIADVMALLKPLYKAQMEEQAKALVRAEQEAQAKAEAEAEAKARAQEEAKAKAEEEERLKREEEERQRVLRLDATLKTYSEMAAMTLVQLVDYVQQKASWHERSTLSDEQRDVITEIHGFASDPQNLAPCGKFKVADIEREFQNASSASDVIEWLGHYVKAAGDKREPFEITPVKVPDKAIAYGEALKKLSGAFPTWVLATAMTEDEFLELVDEAYVDDVIAYAKGGTMKPIFQAEEGADFESYLAMRLDDGVDPRTYQSGPLAPYIRNFHRFLKSTLDALAASYSDTSKSKPLTLILHSAIDHNGAFHRDPNITKVVTNAKNLTLMIEGGESLDDYQSQITPLATSYGNDDKIDQVMFAGHGGSRVIEMAGTIEENTYKTDERGTIAQKEEPIDLDSDPDRAKALFDEILKNMDDSVVTPLVGTGPSVQPNRRILFNACLTNSNEVQTALSTGDIAVARQEVKDYITNNASLATYMQKYAEGKGKDVQSLGANASITQVELIKETTGELDLVAPSDPKVTATKLVYTEEGREPHGVMLAALEAWANDPTATIQAMTRRAAKSSKAWSEAVIEGCFEVALDWVGDDRFAAILQELSDTAHSLDEGGKKKKCSVKRFTDVLGNWHESYHEPLMRRIMDSTTFLSEPWATLVLGQWAIVTNYFSDAVDFTIDILKTDFNAKTAREYVDVKYLDTNAKLAGMLSGGTRTGKTILAIIGVLDKAKPAVAKDYLKARLQPGAPKVPELPEVPEVAPVPEQDAPRDLVAAVPAVKGRPKVDEIPGKRPASPAVPDLEELPELPAVEAPQGPATQAGEKPTVKAPGRKGRPKREAVPEIPEVKPFFDDALKIETHLAGRATVDALIAKLS